MMPLGLCYSLLSRVDRSHLREADKSAVPEAVGKPAAVVTSASLCALSQPISVPYLVESGSACPT